MINFYKIRDITAEDNLRQLINCFKYWKHGWEKRENPALALNVLDIKSHQSTFCSHAHHQTTLLLLLLLVPLYLKSGMLHTLCDLSSRSIPFSTSSETVLRSLNPVPLPTPAVRPVVLPNGLILIFDLKFMLMARLLFHWRASRCASCSSFSWSRTSSRTARKWPDTSCGSGSLACMASLNLWGEMKKPGTGQNTKGEKSGG